MNPPIFDFERWFKDTWGPGCKEGGRIPGYTLYLRGDEGPEKGCWLGGTRNGSSSV